MKQNTQNTHKSRPKMQLEEIADNIAGAILCCKNDRWFTIVFASKGLARMTGYSQAEFAELFQNRLLALVHPRDIKRLLFEIDAQRKHGDSLTLEYRLQRKGGGTAWVLEQGRLAAGRDGQRYYCSVLTDITASKLAQRRQKQERLLLEARAQRDLLTGVYNRVTAQSLIEAFLGGPGKACRHALLVIDLDNFKAINDSLGHLQGDSVLSEISSCLGRNCRPGDIVGRVGGDEFVVLLKNIPSTQDAEKKAACFIQQFRRVLGEPERLVLSGSIGIALYPEHGADFKTLYHKADTALYASKKDGKNCFQVYTAT